MWACTYPRRTVRAPPVRVDRDWFGSQAFYSAKAFNVNIGAWNTARVTTFSLVCAASGRPASRHGRRSGRARPGLDAARPLCAGGTADARTFAHTRVGTLDTRNADISTHAHSYLEDRITDACVHQGRAHVCPHVRVRMSVWARTYPLRTVQALPISVDRVRLGSQAFSLMSAFNADIGAWNTASVSNMYYVCAASGRPASRHRRRPGRARPGLDAARPLGARLRTHV